MVHQKFSRILSTAVAFALVACATDGGETPFSPTGVSPTTTPDSSTPSTTTDAGAPPAQSTFDATVPTLPGNGGGKVDSSIAPVTDAGGTGGPTTDTGVVVTVDAGIGPMVPEGDASAPMVRGDDPTEATTMKDGPFKVMNYTSGFMKASGVDSSTVWYPTDAKPPFAGIAIVPGFVSPESSIRQWGPFLASHGIVAVTIGVPGGDQPGVRATKLLGTIEGLKAENTRSGSPLMGKIDTSRMALAGWSMGGGGTLIAAARTPALKAAIGFAAWGPSGGRNNKVPVLMFEGTADILAAGMSDPYYADVPATVPKMLFEVNGAPHEVANSPKNSGGVIGSWGLSWLKVYLEGDDRYKPLIKRMFPSICTRKCATNVTMMM